LPTPDEWRSEVDQALFGADDDAPPQPEQPGSLDFPVAQEGESEHHVVDADTLDAALFGAREARAVTVLAPLPEPVAPSRVPDDGHEIFAGEESFEEDRTFDEDRTFAGDEHETIFAETADAEDLVEPTGPERGRRRAWVLAGVHGAGRRHRGNGGRADGRTIRRLATEGNDGLSSHDRGHDDGADDPARARDHGAPGHQCSASCVDRAPCSGDVASNGSSTPRARGRAGAGATAADGTATDVTSDGAALDERPPVAAASRRARR
jgi:hypothetical protein